jgi:ferredoxin-type protein NapG
MSKLQSSKRRQALLSGLKASALALMGAFAWSAFISEQAKAKNSFLLRPPGAKDEKEFLAACIRCGLCVEACPYHTLKLADIGQGYALGMPYFTPRDIPCYMCEDIPCVPVCPTKALDSSTLLRVKDGVETLDIDKAKMGIAVVDSEHCVAYDGIRCEVCYRACPLAGDAISIELKHNDRTGKHAMFIPVVNNKSCTGCGKCERACITKEASIFVLPPQIFGKLDSHYAKGWDDKDQQRVYQEQGDAEKKAKSSTSTGAQNYLNNQEF